MAGQRFSRAALNQTTSLESRLDRLNTVQAMLLDIGQLSVAGSDITEFIAALQRRPGRRMSAAVFMWRRVAR